MEPPRWGISVILYHFTAPQFLTGISSEGITRGLTPIIFKGQKAFIYDQQWLTKKKDFLQEWCAGSSLPYDRSECRLTVKIPASFEQKLIPYSEYRLWLGENRLPYFDQFDNGDFDKSCLDWVIYQGRIPRQWIKKIDHKRKAAA